MNAATTTEAPRGETPPAPARAEPPLKVVHAIHSLAVGGMERVVLNLVRQGRQLGQDVTVLCVEELGGQVGQAEAMGARIFCTHKRPGLRPGTIGRIRAVLEEVRPDVVHTHHPNVLLYAGPAARRSGVPVVVNTEHNNYVRKRQAKGLGDRVLGTLYARLAGRFADRIFCVSSDVAAAVRGHHIYPASKVVVVPNGIELAAFESADGAGADSPAALRASLGIPAGAPVVGTVGRVDEVKRQDLLVAAFARVRKQVPEAHLLVVGDGPWLDKLRELAKGLGLNGSVHLAGYQPKPAPYFKAMDVFAQSSRIEGMPLAVLEASAAALPVVASRVGGLPDMVEDGRTGLLFDYGDDAALERHLAALLGDRARARRLGEAGRELVRAKFDVAEMAKNYQRHYHELLARARRAG